LQLQSIVHGVVHLDKTLTQYAALRRRLTVQKMRGVGFREGYHDYVIRRGGLDVFPRLVAAEYPTDVPDEDVPTGNEAFDRLLGGRASIWQQHAAAGAGGNRKIQRRAATCRRRG